MAKAKLDKAKAVVLYKGTDGMYVSVPTWDRLGNPHQGAAINADRFEPGKTYYLSEDMGNELERILEVNEEQTLALLMGRVNRRALAQLGNREFAFKDEL
jgi:hypothetical protein